MTRTLRQERSIIILRILQLLLQIYPKFAQVAKLLIELMEKKEWKWQEKEKNAFNKLKDKMTNSPTLAILYPKQKMRLETNTLEYAIGGVLLSYSGNMIII